MNHHDHHHHDTDNLSDGRLIWAIFFNLLLSVAEVAAGLFSGSLSLLADAAHNFNDCMSLVIALIARRIARKQPDERRTFGYRRAEVIGAFVNLILLIIVGIYLMGESVSRFITPEHVLGWPMIITAGIALVVDLATVFLLWDMSKGSVNLKAGFLHNLSDALASVGVIIGGVLILLYQWYIVDVLITVVISSYILWQSYGLLRPTIAMLMQSVPVDIDVTHVIETLSQVDGVENIHHVHVWELDEQHRALEAHVVLGHSDPQLMAEAKRTLKQRLHDEFSIQHSTLEFEFPGCDCDDQEHVH